jgi:lysophospholipase L1-like esterase
MPFPRINGRRFGLKRQAEGGSSGNLRYQTLLRDEFNDPPGVLTNGSLATDGINVRTVANTGDKAYLAGDQVILTGSSASYGDPAVWYPAQTRVAGLALLGRMTIYSGQFAQFGFDTGQAGGLDGNGLLLSGPVGTPIANGLYTIPDGMYIGSAPAGTYDLAIILRTAGVLFLIRGGAFSAWTPLYLTDQNSTATIYPAIIGRALKANFHFIKIPQAVWFPAPLVSDSFNRANTTDALGVTDGAGHVEANGGAGLTWTNQVGTWKITTNQAQPATLAGDKAIATLDAGFSDGIVQATPTLNVDSSVGLVLRWQDANNYLYMTVVKAGAAATLTLREVVDGVESADLVTPATVASGNRIHAVLSGNKVRLYYRHFTYGGEATVTLTSGTQFGILSTATNSLINDFQVWGGSFSVLDKYFPPETTINVLGIGDSKTAAEGDANGGWLKQLSTHSLNAREIPTRIALGGSTVAYWHENLPAALAAATGTPNEILINLSVNDDAVIMPDETTWKAQLTDELDWLHAKWASARIWVAKSWKRNDEVNQATFNTWKETVVASRSTFAWIGIDESTILPGADNGATMTTDGIHYSDAGEAAIAAAWRALIA